MRPMMLITSSWKSGKTFRLIPISRECAFNECIYDPEAKVLALISKEKKQGMHMLPKLTDTGDIQMVKVGKRDNGKQYAEERKTLETFYEYYIEEKEEIVKFIQDFASNSDSFDFNKYLNAVISVEQPKIIPATSL